MSYGGGRICPHSFFAFEMREPGCILRSNSSANKRGAGFLSCLAMLKKARSVEGINIAENELDST